MANVSTMSPGRVCNSFPMQASLELEGQNIEKRAAAILEAHPHFRGRTQAIGIRFSNRHLYLAGKVPCFYLKQLAQEALRQIENVELIVNQIEVAIPNGVWGRSANTTTLVKPR